MRWSPAIAGKRGRCKCGATVQVPQAVGPSAAPEPEQEDDLLSALERPIRPVVEPTAYANAPTAASAAAPPLPYATPVQQTPDGSREMLREIYVPAAVLVLGFGCMLGWLADHGHFIFAAVIGTLILASVLMVGKTVVLSLFAWALASRTGGSFGHPLGTILKIAGLVVSLDAATLWALSAMVATGAITRRGGFYPLTTVVILFVVTFVAALLIVNFFYGLHGDEASLLSRFVAGGNLVINVVLVIVLAVIAHNVATAARQARAATAQVSSTPGLAAASAPPPTVVETDADRAIESRLNRGSLFIKDPQEWRSSLSYRNKDAPLSRCLDRLSVAGAPRIYVDTSGGPRGLTRIYVDLPSDPEHRNACFAAVADLQALDNLPAVTPEPPTRARFLEIDAPR